MCGIAAFSAIPGVWADTPLGLKPSGFSRPAGKPYRWHGHHGYRDCFTRRRCPRRTVLATAGQSMNPVYRRVPSKYHTVAGTSEPYQPARSKGESRTSPPHDWGSSPDACGGLFLSSGWAAMTFSVGAQAPALRHGESAVSPLCALLCVQGSVLAASSDAAPRAVGPGRPLRRQRGPLGRASPEHPPPSGVGSVKWMRCLPPSPWRRNGSPIPKRRGA